VEGECSYLFNGIFGIFICPKCKEMEHIHFLSYSCFSISSHQSGINNGYKWGNGTGNDDKPILKEGTPLGHYDLTK